MKVGRGLSKHVGKVTERLFHNFFDVLGRTQRKNRCSFERQRRDASYYVRTYDFSTNNLTYLWMVFLFAHIFLSIVLHTTSLWLAVAMAFMRRMTLRVASLNRYVLLKGTFKFSSPWQKSNYAYRISFGVFVVVFILTIPTWYVHEIIKTSYEWKVPEICPKAESTAAVSVIYTINVSFLNRKGKIRQGQMNVFTRLILIQFLVQLNSQSQWMRTIQGKLMDDRDNFQGKEGMG